MVYNFKRIACHAQNADNSIDCQSCIFNIVCESVQEVKVLNIKILSLRNYRTASHLWILPCQLLEQSCMSTCVLSLVVEFGART